MSHRQNSIYYDSIGVILHLCKRIRLDYRKGELKMTCCVVEESSVLDEVIDTNTAAKILGITLEAVQALLRRETIQGKKRGRQWFIVRSSVLDYKKKKEQKENARRSTRRPE